MGSSGSPEAIPLAILFGAHYLVFDAARHFANVVGPMRLRRWSGTDPRIERGSRWFQYDPNRFTIVSGALLQIALVGAVCATADYFHDRSLGRAVLSAGIIWSGIIMVWKFILVAIPESVAEQVLRALIPVSYLFYYLFWPLLFPLRWFLDRLGEKRDNDASDEDVSDEEVQAYIDAGAEEGILEEEEKELVQSVVDFGDRVAHELMTPRIDVLAFDVNNSVEALAKLFSESKYSRIPVYENSIDHIIGTIHVKDLYDVFLKHSEKTIRELARGAYFVSETKKVSELLREFQIEHIQMAVVVDEYGGTSGLITIEDIVEEIVGEIADEHEDDEQSIVEIQDAMYMVNGMTRIDALETVFPGIDLKGDDYETVAGLIFTHTGRVPKVGEIIKKDGLLFEVDRADRRRIYRIRVMKEPEETQPVSEARG